MARRSLDVLHSSRFALIGYALGEVYLTWGQREEAEHQWVRAKEASARTQDATAGFVPFQIDSLLDTLDGLLERPIERSASGRAYGIEVGREQAGRQTAARGARRALIYLGRASEALAGLLDPPQLFFNRGVFSGQRAACLAHLGRFDEARDILHRMMGARDMGSHDDDTPTTVLRYMLEAAVLLKDTDACRLLAERMEPLAGLLHTEADMCFNIGRLLGGGAALLGEPEKARGYYEQAIEVCEKVRFRPELALTRLELAELLLAEAGARAGLKPAPTGESRSVGARHASPSRAGETPVPPEALRAEALAQLDFAIAEFREMKMQPSLERALRHKDVLTA